MVAYVEEAVAAVPSAEESPSTTTISTIAVRAGETATIVVALLKSKDYVELRIDDMFPKLLAIGNSVEETSQLLTIHDDIINRLRAKEDQVHALLSRADALGAEKKDKNESIVYDAMAVSLTEAWRELNKQLMLRGYLLRETLSFYRMARHHEQLTVAVSDCLRRVLAGEGPDKSEIIRKIEHIINEIVDTTASAVDLGSSVMAQIRTLGQIDDNQGRAQEILDACMQIETVMLRIASEWERVEQSWREEKVKLSAVSHTVEETFVEIEEWLTRAERKVKALNEQGQKTLLEEGNAHKARLLEMGASGTVDGARVAHLSGRIEEFLHYLKTRMGRSSRIQAFFQSAQSMLSQLYMMEGDMRNANAAMAGELAPLARQKAASVIQEGRDIAAREVLSHEEQRLVKLKCEELEQKLMELEQLAKQRKDAGTQQVSQELKNLQEWLTTRAEPFLAQNADMGGNIEDSRHFLKVHKEFATEVVNRDASVVAALSKRREMTTEEQTMISQFEKQYEKLKDTLENRIHLGTTFEQVHKFAHDLESSFDALTSLLDTNRDFTNERVAGQMNNVFTMIQETLGQERHQGEKFISSAEQVGRSDSVLNVERAAQTTRNIITDHDHRFTYVTGKWMEWQANKADLKRLIRTVEEVQMWQEEAIEIIRLLSHTKVNTLQENESLNQRVREFRQTMAQQNQKLEEAKRNTTNEQFQKRVTEMTDRQKDIEHMLEDIEKTVQTVNESFMQEEVHERIQAPHMLTTLQDSQVEEGSRFEFAARIEGEPEPSIHWLKDGIDVKSNMDYRQDFVNGVASLVIEETFIEDTATYTVRASNQGGTVESSAKLVVKSRSALSSIIEEDKPRFAQPLRNVSVQEGETARMNCVIVGRPEPEVVWYKEENTVHEDERVRLEFTGDQCSLRIDNTVPPDTGLYTARAKNLHGETTNFCQLKVTPKKQAPPPPPKPASRPPSVLQRPPSIQPALANSTWTEGQTATLQVYTQGEPRPLVQWKFNEQPIQTSSEVKIQEQADGWSRLIISPVSPVHSGMYTVTAENEAGEAKTGATLHVTPSVVTTEHMYQQDMFEAIAMQPVQTTTESTQRKSFELNEHREIREQQPAYQRQYDHETSSIHSEKRWVDIIDEQLSQPSPVMSPIPQPVEVKKRSTTTEQRWVDEIDEVLGTPRVERETRETKTAETYVQMVDDLMRSTVQPAVHEAATSRTSTEYAQQIQEARQPDVRQSTTTPSSKMFNVATIRMSPQPEAHTTTTTSTAATEHAATIRRTPVPESHQATITSASSVENIAAIRQSPVPQAFTATTTQVNVENVAAIRQTPVRELYTAETTQGAAIENAAISRKTPVPQAHQSTVTQEIHTVENIAAIQRPAQPEKQSATTSEGVMVSNIATIRQPSQPEKQSATTSEGVMISNIAQVHAPGPAPDRQTISKEETRVDRVDDVVLQPITKQSSGEVKQSVTTEGFVTRSEQKFDQPEITTVRRTLEEQEIIDRRNIDRQESLNTSTVIHKTQEDVEKERNIQIHQVPESPRPRRKFPETTTTVTHSGEGWVQEVYDEMGQPTQTTVRKYTEEEAQDVRGQQQFIQPAARTTIDTKQETTEAADKTQQSAIPRKIVPQTTTTTTHSGEGWVQEVHDEMGKPTQTTVRRYTEEEARDVRGQKLVEQPGSQTTINIRKETTEDANRAKMQQQSRIPVRREPVTTVTGEGWVQEIHDEFGKPTTTATRRYKDEELEEHKQHLVAMRALDRESHYAHVAEDARSEVSKGQRDSFVLASDAEGFWTDGAYTASPTPPPVPQHRLETEFRKQEQKIGRSTTSTEPEFIRTFHKDYTVEEGGELVMECVLVGNPRPKVQFYFNDRIVRTDSEFCKISIINDTYRFTVNPAKLEHAGFYKITAENNRGYTESLTVVHVRPQSMPHHVQTKTISKPTEHTTVTEEFAMFEYEQRRPQKHETSRLVTPPPAKRLQQVHKRDEEHLEQYDIDERRASGHPPHFTQTLISTVAADGESARFEGIVTGWPAPTVEWTKDGNVLSRESLPSIVLSNIGGRVSLSFEKCALVHSGKYMCTAKNASGVATSSAQLVVRPKTVAPDFVQRLISEEIMEGEQLKWTVRLTGDPKPKVTWLRDGVEIPDCDEVRLVDEGNDMHSLIIMRVEPADSGQFTCLAENSAGEARSTADLVVRGAGATPGNYFHVTKVTQEKQVKGEEPVRNSAFTIENPRQSEML